jgi:outer membrane biosynthesis protein TonB
MRHARSAACRESVPRCAARKSAPEFREVSSGRTSVSTKLYGLVALAVGAVLLGPARAQAQSQSEAEWLACMLVWEDEAICGSRPPPPADEPPPPPPADEPPPPPPADEPPPPPPADEPPPPPPADEPPPPPPAPEPEQCASGKHSGHSVASSGNATGHVCGGADDQRQSHHRHDHGRRHGHAAKARAAVHQFVRWCQSFAAHHGRH